MIKESEIIKNKSNSNPILINLKELNRNAFIKD